MGAGAERGAERGQQQHPDTRRQPAEPRDCFGGTVGGRWSSHAALLAPSRGEAGGGAGRQPAFGRQSSTPPSAGPSLVLLDGSLPFHQGVRPPKENTHVRCLAHT